MTIATAIAAARATLGQPVPPEGSMFVCTPEGWDGEDPTTDFHSIAGVWWVAHCRGENPTAFRVAGGVATDISDDVRAYCERERFVRPCGLPELLAHYEKSLKHSFGSRRKYLKDEIKHVRAAMKSEAA